MRLSVCQFVVRLGEIVGGALSRQYACRPDSLTLAWQLLQRLARRAGRRGGERDRATRGVQTPTGGWSNVLVTIRHCRQVVQAAPNLPSRSDGLMGPCIYR